MNMYINSTNEYQLTKEVKNFMNGKCFESFNPITELHMISLSGFLGEPSYYDHNYKIQSRINIDNYLILDQKNLSRDEIFLNACEKALDYDFKGTLLFAVKCRNEFFMRKSTAQILAIAAKHHKRVEFNLNNPMIFRNVIIECCLIPSDLTSIHNSWISLVGSKSGFPTFMKRAFEDYLKNLSSYQLEKYRKDCIDMVRICHINKKSLKCNLDKNGDDRDISKIMKDGKLFLSDGELKWETLRSRGLEWIEILEALEWRMPHMAALRNIRNFASSDPGIKNMNKYLEMLLSGVENGKQFPFRYISAYNNFKNYRVGVNPKKKNYKVREIKPIYINLIIFCLEECLQKSMKCYPCLEGDVISLSDNSGSAHGTFTSTYGTVTISDIDNLSSLFSAYNCTGRGVVGLFGDNLKLYEVDKKRTLLEQYQEIRKISTTVGMSTENGVWLFFKNAFEDPKNYKFDHWFCYSDMQVGHGNLYGNDKTMDSIFRVDNSEYIEIHECLNKYRKNVNSKINTYMVQTGGYNNAILPELLYRGVILSGWTGNEVKYAYEFSKLWNQIEKI